MPGSWPTWELPSLTDKTCTVTSRATNRYNCIAWAASEDHRNWWPDPLRIGYWPLPKREVTIPAFIEAYRTIGYEVCADDSLEAGLEKIAIFAIRDPFGMIVPTHAALQLQSGEWTSKLGPFEDISHITVSSVAAFTIRTAAWLKSSPREWYEVT
jgi:hypothetical protein